jgi:hypothetical protein
MPSSAASLAQSFREEAGQAAHEVDELDELDDDGEDIAVIPGAHVASQAAARGGMSHAQPLKAAEASLTLPVIALDPVTSLEQVRAELLAIRASLIN